MAKRISSTHIATKAVVSMLYTHADAEVDYPSSWFEKNPGKKPSTTIPGYEGTEEDLHRSVGGGIRAANLTIQTAKILLYTYGLTMKMRIDTDWRSFKIIIGNRETEITPWDILDITIGPVHTPTEPLSVALPAGTMIHSTDPSTWTPRAMVLYILCVYRLLKITNDDYRDILIKRMDNQLIAEGGAGMSFHGVTGLYGSWLNDMGFLKMVAAFDMFLHRLKDHPDSIFRMGTLGSRFRDCAALLSFGFAMSILNLIPASIAGDLMDWIFVKTMGEEMMKMSKEKQESGDKDSYSYFPYQSDLGLVSRSAYSSNSNSYIFHWIHIIGSILGHKRSQNARFNFEGSYADVGLNAVLVAWVYARGGELAPQFEATGTMYGEDIEPIDGDAEVPDMPSQDDKTWLDTVETRKHGSPS